MTPGIFRLTDKILNSNDLPGRYPDMYCQNSRQRYEISLTNNVKSLIAVEMLL
jgi:hypothetical protein